ncbi:MAG: (d)CMP kinase, partial [Ignavibacteria bacterium]|nr:(d)CMP kinase [Ignavibacteria bacterium]
MLEKRLVITIDGPAASGKSTTARRVAERLGYMYIDTGAMYRAVTLDVIRRKIDLRDEKKVVGIAASASIELKPGPFKLHLFLNGEDVTAEIRSSEVTRSVSAVSRIRGVREALVRIQRRLGRDGGVVLEGRDIGTVVFPGADLKIFMVADIRARSRRRAAEMRDRGEATTEE